MSEIINHVPNAAEASAMYAAQNETQRIPLRLETRFGQDDAIGPWAEETAGGLIAKASDNEAAATTITGIIAKGEDAYGHLPDALVARNAHDELMFRKKMAELYVDTPQTYEQLRQHNILGFHGTRSAALAGILEQGALLSPQRINKLENGPLILSGEHLYQGTEGQGSISFSQTGYVDQAANYAGAKRDEVRTTEQVIEKLESETAELEGFKGEFGSGRFGPVIEAGQKRNKAAIQELRTNPKSLRSTLMRHDFPVLIGINADFVADDENKNGESRGINYGQSSMGEFRPYSDEIPLNALPIIAVPRDKMDGVQKLFEIHGHRLTVVPMEDLLAS